MMAKEDAMQRGFRIAGKVSAAALSLVAATAFAGAPVPTLFRVTSAASRTLFQGAQKSWPIQVDENSAFEAVGQGGLWLPSPTGGRQYAKFEKRVVHDNGTWTWIGTISTVHGDQSVVLTFGKNAVFGFIPQDSGPPLQITTRDGQSSVIVTDGSALRRSTEWLRMHSQPDTVVPSLPARSHTFGTTMPAAANVMAASATAPATIDVMVAYTIGLAHAYGSLDAVETRIQYLVDWTNQAYVNSNINQQIRLVKTVEVNYPDNDDDNVALADLQNPAGSTNPAAAGLRQIPSLRLQYRADLVSLMRPYDSAQGSVCGLGYLNGANEAPIVPSQQSAYGYSTVGDIGDGTEQGLSCGVNTFAHELGHNMGDAHDRADVAPGTTGGAYSYSYGYQTSASSGFHTIMAYGLGGQALVGVFSNPDVSTCQNSPCGVSDSDPSNSADNAHSMNNTAPLIAAFEPARVDYAHNDVDGDGKSDLIWQWNGGWNGSQWVADQFAYWIMDGTALSRSLALSESWYGLHVIATGDFTGDGKMDAILTDGTNMEMWVGDGGSFDDGTMNYIGAYPSGWTVAGTGDLNGDGFTDLVWTNGSQIAEWLMDGSTGTTTPFFASFKQTLGSGWRYIGMGDFDGDGKADLLLTNGGTMQMWTNFNNGSFAGVATHSYPVGWTLLGTGDVNGDHKADLLWRDSSQTHFAYWIMGGPQLVKSWSVAVTQEWKFGTSGDFNGDGYLDLVWYNGSQIVMWPGQSSGVYRGTIIHSYPAGAWTMLP
jgi:hypothetical protein